MQALRGLGARYYHSKLSKFLIVLLLLLLPITGHTMSAEHDIEWLAYNIYHEARGEPFIGKVIVAVITINRVEDPNFPNTIYDVITQPAQFSWYWDGKSDAPTDYIAYRECYFIAKIAYDMWKNNDLKDLVGRLELDRLLWYHNDTVAPVWVMDYNYVGRIGNHMIYEELKN